jgi:hypothetical protein
MFTAHINVESCNIKYICKYINKGSDKAVFEVQSTTEQGEQADRRDEVDRYQSGRYISSNEVAWRTFDFAIHHRYPPVHHLSVNLADGQRVYFTEANFEGRLQILQKQH